MIGGLHIKSTSRNRQQKTNQLRNQTPMTKIKIKYLLFATVITAIAASCQTNEIHLDFEKQLICSSNSKGLKRIIIDNINGREYYTVVWNESFRKAPVQLSLSPLTKGYSTKGGWQDTVVNLQYFKLKGNNVYRIERSGGDASGCIIKVLTDKEGRFLKIVP